MENETNTTNKVIKNVGLLRFSKSGKAVNVTLFKEDGYLPVGFFSLSDWLKLVNKQSDNVFIKKFVDDGVKNEKEVGC